MKKNINVKNLSRRSIGILIAFLVVCIIFAAICFQYYQKLHSIIRLEGKNYMQEVSRRVGSNVDRIIVDNLAILNTMAASIDPSPSLTLDKLRRDLKKQQTQWSFENIMLIDDTGKAYDLKNNEVFINFDDNMRLDMSLNKSTMSTTQIINNQEFILFAVPIEKLSINDTNIVYLSATYNPKSFDHILSMTSFDKTAYSQIISPNGSVITRPTSPYALKTGYNIFSALENMKIADNKSADSIKADIKKNLEDQAIITVNKVQYYMVYTPIESNDWYLLSFVPLKVVNEKSDSLLQYTFFICAILTVLFAGLCITIAVIFNNNKKKLEKIAYVDSITAGNTLPKFINIAKNNLTSFPTSQFALIYTNFEKFKVLNDELGRETCNEILRSFSDFVCASLSEKECMGRIYADNFCLLLEYTDDTTLVDRFKQWRSYAEIYNKEHGYLWAIPCTEFGIFVIENLSLDLTQMMDRAKLALKESLHNIDSKLHYAFYNDDVRRKLYREKQLEDKMEQSLKDGEFQVYLQPKYFIPSGKITGAEALVRWVSTDEGMIYPDEFIPLFEKNEFILSLDLYVFGEVCKTLNKWKEQGIENIKISVNCSRVHFKMDNFLKKYINVADKYNIDRSKIEIELTESIVFDNSSLLISHIKAINNAGFSCSMDDFGSGYSSLNLIQEIPVDTLKIDKVFFNINNVNINRTESVVKNIISLAKSLGMETVAEGVEHQHQADMLKRFGCDYIQGYIIAKPMPIDEFENLVFKDGDVVND